MTTRNEVERYIRAEWPEIVERSGCDALRSLASLPKGRLNILGASEKTELGTGVGVLTGVQYLAPASGSGRDVCSNSTSACRAGCLGNHVGRLPMIRPSMQWKTTLRLGAKHLWRELTHHGIQALIKRAAAMSLSPAVRLDGTSDLGDAEYFARAYPVVRFYDYTKSPARAHRWMHLQLGNLHPTLSYSGENEEACIYFLTKGGNVAVPFNVAKGAPLPDEWRGYDVIDGDVHDFRPADPRGVVVGLRWKGPNKTRSDALAAGWLQESAES